MTTYISDTEALSAAIKAGEGKATTRTVSAEEVQKYVAEGTAKLQALGFTAKDMREITITVNPSANRQPSTSRYAYSAYATEVVVSRNSKDWVLESVTRRKALYATKLNGGDFFLNIPAALWAAHTQSVLNSLNVALVREN